MGSILFERYLRQWNRKVRDEIGPGGGLDDATRAVIATIRERTRRGLSRFGKRFTKYSTKHREKRRRLGLRTSVVDLQITGDMLGAMVDKPVRRTWGTDFILSEIKFDNREAESLARIHISDEPRSKIPRRDFFGLTAQEETLIATTFFGGVHRAVPRDKRSRIKLKVFRASRF